MFSSPLAAKFNDYYTRTGGEFIAERKMQQVLHNNQLLTELN
jgi:hypothetical protein